MSCDCLGHGHKVLAQERGERLADAIDTVLRRGETTFVLVDTAGLRRKRHQRQGVEYYSELRALEAAERADVALVLARAKAEDVPEDAVDLEHAHTPAHATPARAASA